MRLYETCSRYGKRQTNAAGTDGFSLIPADRGISATARSTPTTRAFPITPKISFKRSKNTFINENY